MPSKKRVEFDVFNNHVLLDKCLPALKKVDSELLSNNEYSFKDRILKIKTDNTKFGGLDIKFYDLSIRDKINISFEAFSETGVLPKLAVDGSSGNINNTNDYIYKKNEWVFFDEEITITNNDRDFKLLLGLYTSDVGEFKIKNLNISLVSNTAELLNSKKSYAIRKTGNIFEVDNNFTDMKANIRIDKSDKAIMIDYEKPFKYYAKPIPQVTNDWGSNVRISAGGVTNSTIGFRFYDETGAMMLISNLKDGFLFWFTVEQLF